MPKTLDLLECCLTFLPRNLNVFLILNGLNRWEQDFIESRYRHIPHESLDYFDDFQLIWAMAFYERLTFRQTPRQTLFAWPKYRIAHVGAGHLYLTEEFRDRMIENLRSYETLRQLDHVSPKGRGDGHRRQGNA